jgi:Arc/MetJ-type ribon-helix-helix transcriptional regulator
VGERVVSVKMPASLVKELRNFTQAHHYLDLSEQVRSIVRQKCREYGRQKDLRALRDDIEQQIRSANSHMKKEQILQELAKLLKEGEK